MGDNNSKLTSSIVEATLKFSELQTLLLSMLFWDVSVEADAHQTTFSRPFITHTYLD